MLRPLLAVLALTGLATSTSFALQQAASSRFVLATVTTNRGRTIVDIDPDEVVIREGGEPREILSLRVADYPIAVVVDNASGSRGDFDVIRKAAAHFIGRIGHRPIALAFSDPPQIVASLEDDREVVLQRLERATATNSPGALFQSVITAARTIEDAGTPFAAIVVIAATPIGPVPAEILTPILESGATFHAIVRRDPTIASNEAAARSSETLAVLAGQTRGQFTPIFAAASYQAALDRLADRLAPELMLEYLIPAGASGRGDVQLGVRIPGARVNGLGVWPR